MSRGAGVDDGARGWMERYGDAARERLLAWYARNRRALPWRDVGDGYQIVVSEVMLQQTGVRRVIPKFVEFIRRFPAFRELAEAPTSEVIRAWSGLGYNRRAINLQGLAREVVDRHQGRLPRTLEELRALPGIGPYTAAALMSFVHGADEAAIDVNVRRVIGRLAHGGSAPQHEVDETARALVPSGRSADWNQALMDLGSGECALRRPRCLLCPLADVCHYNTSSREGADERSPALGRRAAEAKEPFVGSSRYFRGRLIERLRRVPVGEKVTLASIGPSIKENWSPADAGWLREVVVRLASEGLVAVDGDAVSLP